MTRFGLWLYNRWLNLLGCSYCGRRPVFGEVMIKDKKGRACIVHFMAWQNEVFAPMDKDYVPPA
jgi:hypothetical protein